MWRWRTPSHPQSAFASRHDSKREIGKPCCKRRDVLDTRKPSVIAKQFVSVFRSGRTRTAASRNGTTAPQCTLPRDPPAVCRIIRAAIRWKGRDARLASYHPTLPPITPGRCCAFPLRPALGGHGGTGAVQGYQRQAICPAEPASWSCTFTRCETAIVLPAQLTVAET